MQTIIKRLLTICLLFSLYSCDIEDNKPKISNEPTNIDKNMELVLEGKMTVEEYYALQKGIDDGAAVKADLLKRGYPPEKIQDQGYAYVVEDMIFLKKKLMRDNDNNEGIAKEEQAYAAKEKLINPLFKQTLIRLRIGKSMEGYTTQILMAMNYWNVAHRTTIRFARASGNTSADYDVAVVAAGDKFKTSEFSAAFASLPKGGRAGILLKVNRAVMDALVADKKKLFDAQVTVLAHELGHIIGFEHTDWRTNGEGFNGIDLTTQDDPYSIMHSGPKMKKLNNGIRTGLSIMDKVALQKLYPTEPPTPTVTAGSLTSVNFNWKLPAFQILNTRIHIVVSSGGKIIREDYKYIPPTRLFETVKLPYGPNSGCGCPGGLLVEGDVQWQYIDRGLGEHSKTAVYFRQGG